MWTMFPNIAKTFLGNQGAEVNTSPVSINTSPVNSYTAVQTTLTSQAGREATLRD